MILLVSVPAVGRERCCAVALPCSVVRFAGSLAGRSELWALGSGL